MRQSRTAFALVAILACIDALQGDGGESTPADKWHENMTWHDHFKLRFLPGNASADVDGIEIQQLVPSEVISEMYHPICDMKSPLFQVRNRHVLNADGKFKGRITSGFLSASWIAWLNIIFCLMSLLLTWISLPENPMGDLRTWHIFDQEHRTDLFNLMKQQEIDETRFKAAVRQYWVYEKEQPTDIDPEKIWTDLFEWLTCGTEPLTYDKFRGVYIVPDMPWSTGCWRNCQDEPMPLGCKYSTRVLRALFSAFRHKTDKAQKAWLAITLAADLWPQHNIDSNLTADRSSNIAKDEQEDRPILQRYILNRFNLDEPVHCQMTVRELLPCVEEDFPGYHGLRNFPIQRFKDPLAAAAAQKKARSYVTSMLDRPMRIGGTDIFLPYNTKTGLAIFLFLAATGTVSNCVHVLSVSYRTWAHAGSFWVKMSLTFKAEVYLRYFYHNVNLLLTTIRLMAMMGMDPIARRHAHGLGLLNFKYFKERKYRCLVLMPALLSITCQIGNFIFIPVTLAWVGVGLCLVRSLEPWTHRCVRPFNTPMFTTAPLLALLFMEVPLTCLSSWLLPDTFVCTWARLELVSPTLLGNVNDPPSAVKFFGSLTRSSIAGLIGALALGASLSILAWLAFKLQCTKQVVTDWFFMAWVRQSEDLLSLLHKNKNTATAEALGNAWRLANMDPEDKQERQARDLSRQESDEDSDTDKSSTSDTSSRYRYHPVPLPC